MNGESVAPQESRSPEVFISYAQADAQVARELGRDLELRGWTTFDLDNETSVGEDWSSRLTKALTQTSAVVVLVSPDYAESRWSALELNLALQRAETGASLLIPIILPGSDFAELP